MRLAALPLNDKRQTRREAGTQSLESEQKTLRSFGYRSEFPHDYHELCFPVCKKPLIRSLRTLNCSSQFVRDKPQVAGS